MIDTFDAFPTRFFTYKITDTKLLQNLYDEVYSKRDKIKSVSWANQSQSSDVYITDYSNTVEIDTFNLALSTLNKELSQLGFVFENDEYWTVLYKKIALHPMHIHRPKTFIRSNYSGILYLTNSGSTNFFTNNPSSFDNELSVTSEAGRFILFPSILPHQVVTDLSSDEERCVIAFNGELREV